MVTIVEIGIAKTRVSLESWELKPIPSTFTFQLAVVAEFIKGEEEEGRVRGKEIAANRGAKGFVSALKQPCGTKSLKLQVSSPHMAVLFHPFT